MLLARPPLFALDVCIISYFFRCAYPDTSTYVNQESFCLYFKPNKNCRQRSINVLPDFFRANTLEISHVSIDGRNKTTIQPNNFRLELDKDFCSHPEPEIIVEFKPLRAIQYINYPMMY